jgi:hypothetical protein
VQGYKETFAELGPPFLDPVVVDAIEEIATIEL